MTAQSYGVFGEKDNAERRDWAGLHPGGWGDRLVFGYMFRILISIVAIVFPTSIVIAVGWFNQWQIHSWMLWFIGIFSSFTIAVGEVLRASVYENRKNKSFNSNMLDSDEQSAVIKLDDSYRGGSGYTVRFADIAFSAGLILFFLPVFLAVAALIKFDSRGPVFQRSRRIGYQGKPFNLLRFRAVYHVSNAVNNDITSELHAGPFTNVGRFLYRTGIRELPSIFNVFGGSMSMIGVASLPDSVIQDANDNEEMSELIRERLEMLYFLKPGFINVADDEKVLAIPVIGKALRFVANIIGRLV